MTHFSYKYDACARAIIRPVIYDFNSDVIDSMVRME